MEKRLRIIQIIVGVAEAFVFIVTGYSLYRAEINPNAPPLIDILPDWHWAVWLSILLAILVIILVIELFRRSSSNVTPNQYSQSPHAGRDIHGDINYFLDTKKNAERSKQI